MHFLKFYFDTKSCVSSTILADAVNQVRDPITTRTKKEAVTGGVL